MSSIINPFFKLFVDSNLKNLQTPIVLFGNGALPKHPTVFKKIKEAQSVICLDGAVDKLNQIGLKPNILLGDFDSIKNDPSQYGCETISLPNQSMSDLEKSLEWCANMGIKKMSLIGFAGERDDHYMAALWIILSYAHKIKLVSYTDFSSMHCVKDNISIETAPGQLVSIISPNKTIKITTEGLKYELHHSSLISPSNGISNVAQGEKCTIQSTDWIWVFVNYNK